MTNHACARSSCGVAALALSAAGVLLLASGQALGDVAVGGMDLTQAFPGIRSESWQGRPVIFYGRPMNGAPTSDRAADDFARVFASGFGVGTPELTLTQRVDLGEGRTAFKYRQTVDGLAVELGAMNVLTLEGGAGARASVVMASGKLAERPQGGFAPDTVDADGALAKAQAERLARGLHQWSKPELVVFFGEGDLDAWVPAVRAWKVTGAGATFGEPRKFSFFVSAADGSVLAARNEILHVDITGQVRALISPNNQADVPSNPPVSSPVPEIRVTEVGTGVSVFTDRDGNFTIPWVGSAPVTLEVSVRSGLRTGVNNEGGEPAQTNPYANNIDNEIVTSEVVTPGVPATLTLNAAPAEATTAQVNGFVYQTQTRNYFKDLQPTFTGLDTPLPVNVMIPSTCNAFYDGTSTNYYAAGGGATGCNNTAFASVVAHEYGHHIVNRLNLAQRGFGEGFSDTISMLQFDDPIIGRDFRVNGTPVRTPATTIVTYPCGQNSVHGCGMMLGGSVWRLREELGLKYGSAPGLARARDLHSDWAMITIGGLNNQAIHPITAIEFLVANDVDGVLCNGTPDYAQIRTAFESRGVQSPDVESRLNFGVVVPPAATSAPGAPIPIAIDITPGTSTLTPGSVQVWYRHSEGNSFFSAALSQSGPTTFSGSIPAGNCGQVIEAYVTADTPEGVARFPAGCDQLAGIVPNVFSTRVGDAFPSVADNFDFDQGWTVGPNTASAGLWTRSDPLYTGAQPDGGSTPGDTMCWFTGQAGPNDGVGVQDVDGGRTILASPLFNTLGWRQAVVGYDRWFSNGLTGSLQYTNVFRVEFTIDGGASWLPLETIGPGGPLDPDTVPVWNRESFPLDALGIGASSQFGLRFIAEDVTGSIVEAAIDAFNLRGITCTGGCNDIDFNNDGIFPDNADIVAFITVFASGSCSTGNCDAIDFNDDGIFPDNQDLVAFIQAFAGGGC
jgi:hypothetical protein